MPIVRTVVRSIATKAANGKDRQQKMFVEMVLQTERADKKAHDEYLQAMAGYKFKWDRELENRKAHNLLGPEPLPHPDDIEVDMNKGTIIVKGPLTKEEKVRWDRNCNRIDQFNEDIELTMAASKDAAEIDREFFQFELAEFTRFRDLYMHTFGHYRTRTRSGRSPPSLNA